MNLNFLGKLAVLALVVIILAFTGNALLAIALNAFSIAGYLILAYAMVFFLPVIVRALRMGAMRADSAITVADPLGALKVEADNLFKYISKQSDIVSKAEGDLAHLKSIVLSSSSVLSPERTLSWNNTIESQTRGIDIAKFTLSDLIKEHEELKVEIEGAKLELQMLEVSNSVSNTINGSSNVVMTEKRQEAVRAINRRTEQAKAKLNNAISKLELERGTA